MKCNKIQAIFKRSSCKDRKGILTLTSLNKVTFTVQLRSRNLSPKHRIVIAKLYANGNALLPEKMQENKTWADVGDTYIERSKILIKLRFETNSIEELFYFLGENKTQLVKSNDKSIHSGYLCFRISLHSEDCSTYNALQKLVYELFLIKTKKLQPTNSLSYFFDNFSQFGKLLFETHSWSKSF